MLVGVILGLSQATLPGGAIQRRQARENALPGAAGNEIGDYLPANPSVERKPMGKHSPPPIDQLPMRHKRKRSQTKKAGLREVESAAKAQKRDARPLIEPQESSALPRNEDAPQTSNGEAGLPESSQVSRADAPLQALVKDTPSQDPARGTRSQPPLGRPDRASEPPCDEGIALEQEGLKQSNSRATSAFEQATVAVHPTNADRDASESFARHGAPAGMTLERHGRLPFSAEIANLRLEAAFFETKAFEFQNKLAKAEVELFSLRQEFAHAQGSLAATDKKVGALEGGPYAELMLQALLSHKRFEREETFRIESEPSKEAYYAGDIDAATHEHVPQINAAQSDELADLRLSAERMRQRAEDAERRAEEHQNKHNKAIEAMQTRLDHFIELHQDRSRKIVELDQSALTQKSELKDLRSQLLDSKRRLMKNAVALAGQRQNAERRNMELAAIKQRRLWRLTSAFRTMTKKLKFAQRMLIARRRPNPLFDTAYYLERYPDVAARGQDPYAHYLRFGADEGRDPNPLFDTKWYYERYPDVKKAGFNPLLHYYLMGAGEGRDPHPLFCTKWYLSQHPELARTQVNALLHFLRSNDRLGKGRGAETK